MARNEGSTTATRDVKTIVMGGFATNVGREGARWAYRVIREADQQTVAAGHASTETEAWVITTRLIKEACAGAPPGALPGSSVVEAFPTMLAILRVLLHTVKARKDFDSLQTEFSNVQLAVDHLKRFSEEIVNLPDGARLENIKSWDWFSFRGLLGIVDAEAWRLLDSVGTGSPANHELDDFEHCLQRLAELGERVSRELSSGEQASDWRRH